MEWFSALPGVIGPLVGGVLLLLLPKMGGTLTPFGVSVPETKVSEPAIRTARRIYLFGVSSAAVIAVACGLILAVIDSKWQVPASMAVLTVIAAIAFSASRRLLIQAKRRGNWYGGVKVGLAANVGSGPRNTGPVWFGHLASLAVTVSSAILGAAVYAKLPDRIASHWSNLAGPDGFSNTSILSAFTFVIAALVIAAVCAAIAWGLKYAPTQNRFSTDPETAERYGSAQLKAGQIFLASLSFGMALSIATLNSLRWTRPEGAFPVGIPLAMLAATLVLSGAAALLRYRRSITLPPQQDKVRADSPDDDKQWISGLFYFNKEDKSILVPKRFGIGWTINAGTPAGALILAALIALVAVGFTITIGNILR